MNRYDDTFNKLFHRNKAEDSITDNTFVYLGSYKNVDTKIEVYELGGHIEYYQSKTINDLIINDTSVYWVNINGLANIDLLDEICKVFEIEKIDMIDILQVSNWGRYEVRENYKYFAGKMIVKCDENINREHISVIVKEKVVISFQEKEGDVFTQLRNKMANLKLNKYWSSQNIFWEMLNSICRSYYEVFEYLTLIYNEIESSVLLDNRMDEDKIYYVLKECVYLKNATYKFMSIISNHVSSNSNTSNKKYIRLRSDSDQLYNAIVAFKDMLQGLIEIHKTDVSNKMNKTMMTLTIISVIFIPLSFLAGVFGMNFTAMPLVSNPSGFFFFIIMSVILVVFMLGLFKKNKWL